MSKIALMTMDVVSVEGSDGKDGIDNPLDSADSAEESADVMPETAEVSSLGNSWLGSRLFQVLIDDPVY